MGKSTTYVLPLDQASYVNKHLVGGKAASLGEMLNANINVPNGFVITTDTFKDFKGDLEGIMPAVQAMFEELSLSRVAVRSSAVAEDGSDASWAGQLESVLNVTKETLAAAIQECWDSIKSDRAQSYAEEHDVSENEQLVAVVVQRMVDSDISGVMFTANPITQSPDQLVVEAVYGLGELLVQGVATPETLVIDKNTNVVLEREAHRQSSKLVYKDGKTIEVPVIESGDILSADLVSKLVDNGVWIEQYYGTAQDIEFAFNDNDLYIVQSRPITTLQIKRS